MFQILIVEDDKELSQLFQKVLEKNGYQVKSASDGALALEILDKEHGPHLAVHIAAAPCPVLIDSVDGDALLHTARHLAAAVGSLGGRILT